MYKSQISDMFINLRFVVLYFARSLCVCVFDIKINEFDVFQYAEYAVIIYNEHETTTATIRIVSKSVWKHGIYKIHSQSYASVNNHYFSIWFHLVCFYFCDCLFVRVVVAVVAVTTTMKTMVTAAAAEAAACRFYPYENHLF